MPKGLRNITIRHLEASIETLTLAAVGLALPRKHSLRQSAAMFAPQAGLIGAAAELGLSACLVQAYGEKALECTPGRFKTGAQILAEFRSKLSLNDKAFAFLTAGVDDRDSHLNDIREATSTFRGLLTARAAALHAGVGPTYEACVTASRDVRGFLRRLARSKRMAPYITGVPKLPRSVGERTVLIEDLARQLSEGSGTEHKKHLLSSVYLVVPNIPDHVPDGFEIMNSVSVLPQDRDIRLLVRSLEGALPVQLVRTSRHGPGMSVTVRPNDKAALPIAPQFLHRSITDLVQKWHSDVGTANGRLEKGVLDLPPVDFIFDLMLLGPGQLSQRLGKTMQFAHEIWPFVASSLVRPGTPGPYWFLIRMTNDLGQLRSLLRQASTVRGASKIAKNLSEVRRGIEILQQKRTSTSFFEKLQQEIHKPAKSRESLTAKLRRHTGTVKALGPLSETLEVALLKNESLGGIMTAIAVNSSSLGLNARRFWARVLAEATSEVGDIEGLVGVLRCEELSIAHSAAKKALRYIDMVTFGPAARGSAVAAALSQKSSHGSCQEHQDVGRVEAKSESREVLPQLRGQPKIWNTVWLPRILWALEWARGSGKGPIRASEIAVIFSEYGGIPVAKPNVARAFRELRKNGRAPVWWCEEPAGCFTITQTGTGKLMELVKLNT